MSARISVRISQEVAAKLARRAAASERRSSDLVREALETFLDRNSDESCFDLAKKSKLAGAVRNAPSDLSTNRDYFENFGRS